MLIHDATNSDHSMCTMGLQLDQHTYNKPQTGSTCQAMCVPQTAQIRSTSPRKMGINQVKWQKTWDTSGNQKCPRQFKKFWKIIRTTPQTSTLVPSQNTPHFLIDNGQNPFSIPLHPSALYPLGQLKTTTKINLFKILQLWSSRVIWCTRYST